VTTQIAIRLDERELAALDAEVAEGRAANRFEAVRRTIARLQHEQRYRREEATLVELAGRHEAGLSRTGRSARPSAPVVGLIRTHADHRVGPVGQAATSLDLDDSPHFTG